MCDCYGHKCEMCDTLVPMHIGDFSFPRELFKVWCPTHSKKAPVGAVLFRITEHGGGRRFRRGLLIAILGPDVGGDGNNYPNLGVDNGTPVRRRV